LPTDEIIAMNQRERDTGHSPTSLLLVLKDKLGCDPPIIQAEGAASARRCQERFLCRLLEFLWSDWTLWKKTIIGVVGLGLFAIAANMIHSNYASIKELKQENIELMLETAIWQEKFNEESASLKDALKREEIARGEYELLARHAQSLEQFFWETRDFMKGIMKSLPEQDRETIYRNWQTLMSGEDTTLHKASWTRQDITLPELKTGLKKLQAAILKAIEDGDIDIWLPTPPPKPPINPEPGDCRVFVAGGLSRTAASNIARNVSDIGVSLADGLQIVAVSKVFQGSRHLPRNRRTSILIGLSHSEANEQIEFTQETAHHILEFSQEHETLGPMFRRNNPYVDCLR
jgi:hypothetical protein